MVAALIFRLDSDLARRSCVAATWRLPCLTDARLVGRHAFSWFSTLIRRRCRFDLPLNAQRQEAPVTRRLAAQVLAAILLTVNAATLIHAQAPAPTSPTTQTARPAGRRSSAAAKPGRATPASPVNLNTATASDLQTLPGIGKATAARILEYRQKNGFHKIEDLMNVRGIGEKSFLKLKPLITLAPKGA
jgi:comEA protein